MTEPMYVVVQSREGTGWPEVCAVRPYDDLEQARVWVEHLREIADAGGRVDDTYQVYELIRIEREVTRG